MRIEDQYSVREKLESEAFEESDKIPRLTILENGPSGWGISSSIKWIKNLILG